MHITLSNTGILQKLEFILVRGILIGLIFIVLLAPSVTVISPMTKGIMPFSQWFGDAVDQYENKTWEEKVKHLMFANLEKIGGTTVALKDKQIQCLARNIYYESRGESLEGQISVAHVTLTRLDEGYSKTVCGVVHQRNPAGCQFEWVCKLPSLSRPVGEMWEQAVAIATTLILLPGEIEDPTNGATHFHATYLTWTPAWAKKPWQKIGNHIFYRYKPKE